MIESKILLCPTDTASETIALVDTQAPAGVFEPWAFQLGRLGGIRQRIRVHAAVWADDDLSSPNAMASIT